MTLIEELKSLLKKDERLVSDDKLLKNRIVELALKLDKDLIKLLLSNKKIKEYFFTEVDKTLIFDKEKFMKFVDNKEFLPDSYTSFKNKIGLTVNNTYITKKKEVILSWPYKDCILEGGQEKEDEKRKEIFYNEILAPDEIDRLLEPKVFTNFKRIDAKGEHKITEIKPTDNLIIKGNNLLVLHSLKKRFAGKVKLIYIDPPYNTGNDEFNYNDNFNHSTWLTFMKNRLEIAKELLREDGSIYINIDYNEVHYLKVLMDEIFGKNNFQREIIWRMGFVSGYKTAVKNFIRNHDTILFYSKNSDLVDFNKVYIENKDFKVLVPFSNEIRNLFKSYNIDEKTAEKILNQINFGLRGDRYPLEDTWNCNKWDDLDSIAIENSTSRVEETVMMNDRNFKGQKPEKLIKRIVESSSNKGDIVLDFFMGTGTTCAVAHKMGRQYIGIEQMDYGENIAVARLKNVINGDQSGISKSVNWQGGGDFVYCELKELNEEFIQKIMKANDSKELLKIWEDMKQHAFLSYRVDPKLFDENIEEFKKLSAEEQKKLLIECLDANNLYVNYSEIKDSQYKISNEDIEINNKFYRGL